MEPGVNIEIHCRELLGPVAGHGADILKRAAAARNTVVNIGTWSNEEIRLLVETGKIPLAATAEAYAFGAVDGKYYLAGYDERGLLYGCQELYDQLNDGTGIEHISFAARPFTKTRGICAFLHNRDLEAEWFFSPGYWQEFFDQLARDRFNSFNLVFSHQTSYLAPMFAYFLEIDRFPHVRPQNLDSSQIRRNGDMLRYISATAEARGIDFILGIWQFAPWKNQQGSEVNGLDGDNLQEYTYCGMKQIIKDFPAIRGVQVRTNSESGILPREQVDFFTGSVFRAIAEAKRPFKLDLRCWLAEPDTIKNALAMIPDTRLSCKYWAEFLGAPYQPAKIEAGYSYADLLKRPHKNDLLYQVWNLGSPRLLLWGDEAYVRRFVHSLKLGESAGFEINMHLAQKGYGNEPGCWRIFKHPEEEYYRWEYERYWLFRRLFGRLSYDPDCAEAAWTRELAARFAANAEKVMKLYNAGSGIITFLVQFSLSDLNMYIWPEIDTGGLLEYYARTPASDKCVIDNVEEYVKGWVSDRQSGKLNPRQSSDYFSEMAAETFKAISDLEKTMDPSRELVSTIRDFKIMAWLGLFHSKKILAAIALEFWRECGDIADLRECRKQIRQAAICWEQLVSLTSDVYHERMITGPAANGHWRDKLELVYEDELRINELIYLADKFAGAARAFDFGPVTPAEYPIRSGGKNRYAEQYMVEHGFIAVDAACEYSPEKGYGWESGEIGEMAMPAVRLNDSRIDHFRRDTWERLPAEKCKGMRSALFEDALLGRGKAVFRCDLENGDYEVSIIMADQTPDASVRGPMTISVDNQAASEFCLMPLEEDVRTTRVNIESGILRITFQGSWFISGMIIKSMQPVIRTKPYVQISPASSIITAAVTSPEDLKDVTIFLEDGSSKQMKQIRPAEYFADVGKKMPFGPKQQAVLAITAVTAGGLRQHKQVKVYLCDRKPEFELVHKPVEIFSPGEDIVLDIEVKSTYELRRAVLHYSHANQLEEMRASAFTNTGCKLKAKIPGSYADSRWDLLYYIELVDTTGNGIILPDMKKRTPYWVIRPVE